ncbi:hypothetical protein KHA93_16795 [Bacillus sp. FJAT-49732]|uniref:Preprotein translocase subunit Tim44 n=1 Tax=Lederbergia citrisecunda TaxID=2833583 RepID=A0A942TN09_9BACI|nr:hypothetical protein [Lederbergia citrisecunda]MBS4201296.1 hypothetical protein [Lederbergia citrisecunda]
MKKLLAALLATVLLLSPVGSFVFQDHSTTVEAKGYKSGKKSFNMNNSKVNNNSNFQKKKQESNTTNNKSTTTTNNKGGLMSGGLMKGLMFGGLAGLLFGGLFANMGELGSILGFIINIAAIMILISVIRKIFAFFNEKKKKEDINPWRG